MRVDRINPAVRWGRLRRSSSNLSRFKSGGRFVEPLSVELR
jgi:hypothetical protein